MVDIFYTFEQTDTEQFIKQILHKYYNIPNAEICKSINGKPYIKGDKVFFNATHSKGLLALAVGKRQVGLDCECLDGKARPAVLSKFSEREKREIHCTGDFYEHWTAREAYIKYLGLTLASDWRRVEYCKGKIHYCGNLQELPVLCFKVGNYTLAVCGHYSKLNIRKI